MAWDKTAVQHGVGQRTAVQPTCCQIVAQARPVLNVCQRRTTAATLGMRVTTTAAAAAAKAAYVPPFQIMLMC